MLVPNRHGSSTAYRYGFNGKENDNEVMGEGNFEDYGMRSYNPRIGRFFNVDPLIKKYPELTPYQFASNTPIQAVDLDGLELFLVNGYDGYSSRTKVATNTADLAEMKSYWTNNNPKFVEQAKARFKEKDVRFVDGSQGGLSHGSVKVRHDAGYKLALQLVKAGKVDFSNPITLLGHSMGGAFADGMADGFLKANPKSVINILLLAPDGAEQFDVDKRTNSAQFTFGNDGIVTDNKAAVKNIDVDLNAKYNIFETIEGTSIKGGMQAHSAPIDDKVKSNEILNNDKTKKIFKTKK